MIYRCSAAHSKHKAGCHEKIHYHAGSCQSRILGQTLMSAFIFNVFYYVYIIYIGEKTGAGAAFHCTTTLSESLFGFLVPAAASQAGPSSLRDKNRKVAGDEQLATYC